MRRYGPAVLLALVGAAILRVSAFSELYLRYVQPGLRPWLVVSGTALTLLALAAGVTARAPGAGRGRDPREPAPQDGGSHGVDAQEGGLRGVDAQDGGSYGADLQDGGLHGAGPQEGGLRGASPQDGGSLGVDARGGGPSDADPQGAGPQDGGSLGVDARGGGPSDADPRDAEPRHDGRYGHGRHHGHEHAHGPRVAWLLTLPALALLLFPPPALGSYSAEREAAQRAARGVGTFPALPAGDPLDLTLGEFGSRAVYDSGRSLRGRTIRLTGFVTRDADGTWYVTRLLVSCCAADASTAKAEVRGADAPAVDTWVTVTGTWHPEGALGSDAAWPPVVDAASVRPVPQPDNPYEKR
ncbi:TIGR03943 family putative permease subunit [Streptomyces sp. NPDC057838]|uniref:TIGR03943 family putative permease subunit n=1 Tax=unclassified Streptomyces TaxID=2593676 RepID=UPI0036A7FD47